VNSRTAGTEHEHTVRMNTLPAAAAGLALAVLAGVSSAADLTQPLPTAPPVFEERDGIVTIEAEHFHRQTLADKRAWHITSSPAVPAVKPDADPAHLAGASGGAYVECLPDTRQTHADTLIKGDNFSDEPGRMAVLHYRVRVTTPGRYYVWARVYSTGSEDNGLHFGLDGRWPASGARWQTTRKDGWHWDCRQRTAQVHVGVPMQSWLDIATPGEHELLLSMREDGTEVDQILLARSPAFRPPGVNYAPADKSAPSVKSVPAAPLPRQPDGRGTVAITGELKQWHKVTLTLDGPFAHERDTQPNPFTDLAFNVTFTHESGSPRYVVPGYFAADGNAGNTSAESGTKWRAHLAPDKTGRWHYTVSFRRGAHAALNGGGQPVAPFDGMSGSFTIAASDKTGRDFRAHGRLQYVGRHHLQFAGSKQYFLKAGPDAPETLLACVDFDNTTALKPDKAPLKTWAPHERDWKPGDPTWRDGKGKGLIGALNYLAAKGVNAFSFLTYNAAGDGDNVWPFVERDARLHYDCSKLDQWGVVFDHATALGLHLHFKLQENEMDDNRLGAGRKEGVVPESLDGGKLGIERKLYCRELIARFGHALALNWNIGEENTQSSDEIRDMVKFLHDTDPYRHPIVLHTFPPQQDEVYRPLLGHQSLLTGVSLQNPWDKVHQRTLQWLRASAAAGRPWVVANDEQNPAGLGVPPDPGYRGHDGVAVEKRTTDAATGNVASRPYTLHDIRKLTLWGNLMAGGAGVEYYFGYALPENDLVCEDFRSRDRSWDYCRIALEFFRAENIPFWEMTSANALIGNLKDDNSKYCFAQAGELYLVYLPEGTKGGATELDLTGAPGAFTVRWFNPRAGGRLTPGTVPSVTGGAKVSLGNPPADAGEDWLVVVRR
jgi:hypothetical protein